MKRTAPKIMLVLAVAVLLYLFFLYDLHRYLTLTYLKSHLQAFQDYYGSHRGVTVSIYMAAYILMAALSLPGAAVMTLAGAVIFGLWVGLIVVSFASTIGATLACIVSRFLLRDWVQNKFADKLAMINAGIEKEGAFYLFSLRLVPIFPFFVINLVMGLTRMRLLTFFWVSQIGMLAGTIVYVNAGKELAGIDSLSGILSPAVLISFAILGLFPIAVKKLLALYNRRFKKVSPNVGGKAGPSPLEENAANR